MESRFRESADWSLFAESLPLAASQASSLVLFRLIHHSNIGELEITPSVERMTGHPAEDFHRDPELLLRLTSDDDRPAMRELLTGSGDDEPRTRVIRIRRRDGETISAAVQTVEMGTEEGGRRVYGAMRDVSGW